MKTLKILAIALAALMATACSDDDEYPTNTKADAVVEMGELQVSYLENWGLFNVPVNISGTRDGYVTINVECFETGEHPAIADLNYYLTNAQNKGSKTTVRIAPDAKTANIEFRTVDERRPEDDKTFIVRITGAQGATVGAQNATTVVLVDKGSSPKYIDLGGNWFITGLQTDYDDAANNNPTTLEFFNECVMRANDPEQKTVTLVGAVTTAVYECTSNMTFTWDYDEDYEWGQLVLKNGAAAGTWGPYELRWITPGNADLVGRWNTSYTSVTFGNANTELQLMAYEDGVAAGVIDVLGHFTITKLN